MTQEQVLDKYAKARTDVLRKFRLLDCFCGMGGVSDGFAMEGFDVTGIDIVDAPKMLGYKHKFIQADMMTLKGEDFRGYDVIWGSPPCRDFSKQAKWLGRKWVHNPPNPEKGLKLVHSFLEFVVNASPRLWILENVRGLKNYLQERPILETRLTVAKHHCFWGNFPYFLMPLTEVTYHDRTGQMKIGTNNKLGTWMRAKIPLACSRAFARACKEKLLETQTT